MKLVIRARNWMLKHAFTVVKFRELSSNQIHNFLIADHSIYDIIEVTPVSIALFTVSILFFGYRLISFVIKILTVIIPKKGSKIALVIRPILFKFGRVGGFYGVISKPPLFRGSSPQGGT